MFPYLWLGFSDFNLLLTPHSSSLLLLLLLLLLYTPLPNPPAKPVCCTPLLHPSSAPLYLRPPVLSWASPLLAPGLLL